MLWRCCSETAGVIVGALLHFRKANVNGVSALVPTDEESEAWLKRIKIGAAVAMSAEQVRNAERSALYWVMD